MAPLKLVDPRPKARKLIIILEHLALEPLEPPLIALLGLRALVGALSGATVRGLGASVRDLCHLVSS